jgi:hypothetical protein
MDWFWDGGGVGEGDLLPRMSRQDREHNVPVFHLGPMGVFVLGVKGWINEVVWQDIANRRTGSIVSVDASSGCEPQPS